MAATERVIRVTIDASGTDRGRKRLETNLKAIGKAGHDASRSTADIANQYIKTGGAAERMAKQLKAANNNAGGLTGTLVGMSGPLSDATGRVGGFVAALRGLGPAGAIVAGLAAAIALLAGPVVSASTKVESMKASLTTITGDANKAAGAFDALAAYAAKTPFTLDQAVNGFVKLSALGLTPSERALTSYGNTAAAMGKDLSQMVEAVADATTGEFERLKEFGIKSKSEGDRVKFTFAGVTTEVGKNAGEIEKYLLSLGETKFAGAMERQANTIGGSISELKDNIFLAFAELGEGGMSAAFSEIFRDISSGVKAITPLLGGIGNVLGGIIDIAWELVKGIGSIFGALFAGAPNGITFLEGLTFAFNFVGEAAKMVGFTIETIFGAIATVVGWVTGTIRSLFGDAFDWLLGEAGTSTKHVGLSFIGILRAVKHVAINIPTLFKTALNAVGNIFGALGSRIVDFLSGNWNAFEGFGAVVETQIASVGKVATAIGGNVEKILADTEGNQKALDRMLGRTGKIGSIDDYAKSPVRSPDSSEADKAKEVAEKRAKAEAEFFRNMEHQAKAAGMLTYEAEQYNKELELRKIINDGNLLGEKELSTAQKQRIKDLLTEKGIAEATKALRERQNDALAARKQLDREIYLLGSGTLEQAEEQLRVDKARDEALKEFVDRGIPASNIYAENAAKAAEAAERELIAREKIIAGMRSLKSQAQAYDERTNPIAAARSRYEESLRRNRDSYDGALSAGLSSEAQKALEEDLRKANMEAGEVFKEEIEEAGRAFSESVANSFDEVADAFGGKLGRIVGSFGKVFSDVLASFKPDSELGKSLNSIFGKGSDFQATMGQISQGAQIGSEVAGIAKALGFKKFSTTGSQIGGSIGSVVGGPIGAFIGSAIGGTIGGIIKGTKRGSASIGVGPDGALDVTGIRGNSGKMEGAAQDAAGAVISGLYNIAERLGADLGGNPRVSIGLRDGKFRVDPNGRGVTKTKNGAIDFGKDGAEAAIAFAIQDAIKDGILTGLSGFSNRLLRNAKNLDSAVSLAESYEKVLDELAAIDDPLKASIDQTTGSLNKMLEMMRKAGATSAELANVERYKKHQLDQLLKEQLSGLEDFKKALSGEGSGVTALSRLQTSMTEFKKLEGDLAAGKTVDQELFTRLGGEIFSLAGEIYGTSTSAFQDIRAMLMESTDAAIQNVKDTTAEAIQQQTDQLVQAQTITNGHLQNITDLLRGVGGGVRDTFRPPQRV